MKLQLFNITNFRTDGGAMFGVVPKMLWSRAYPADNENLIVLSLRSLIIETGNRIILVDTGWGDKQDENFFRFARLHGGEGLILGLANRGYKPEDITDVILTHLHADHCGGAVRKKTDGNGYELTFPNATYHLSRAQWEWAKKGNPREADSFFDENILPLGEGGQLNLVETDCELYPGISVRICFGHTPGLMIPLISYNGKTVVYAGDLIPTLAHIPLIWNMAYDLEPLKTIDEKEKLLNEAVENDYILVFQHDEKVECCTLRTVARGIRADKTFTLESIL
jgi:glyoxylase-like metal-dependent hydrolase (beta-lactamase superfamily II)